MDPRPGVSGDGLLGPDLRASVLAALEQELADRRSEVAQVDPRLLPEVDRLVEFATVGGKVVRGSFLCLGYLAVSADLPPEVIRAAGALELLQACALVHDDLIDRSDTRRGRPSVHRAVAGAHAAGAGSLDVDHLGVAVALLLGDLALAWADDLLVDAATALGRLAPVLPHWRAVRTEVLSGQLLDVLVTARPTPDPAAQLADAELVNTFKTAAYTVTRPLLLGAALAGADPRTAAALAGYGRAVGLAFQLRDDLLGVFGDPAVTGKPVAGDLLEGKRTVLVARARQGLAGSPDRLAELDAGLGSPAADPVRLTHLLRASGAPDLVTAEIDTLVGTAVAALDGTGTDGRPAVRPEVAATLTAFARASAARAR